jgi:shikimate dehydrogenase
MRNFGLIGFPLVHSFSKRYFTDKFEREGIDAGYDLYELKNMMEFPALIQQIVFSGLNVTIPYKEKVITFLDEIDETATQIGAVNVIRFIRNGNELKLKGYNSDAIGFEKSIVPALKDFHHHALILGTGGASKAVDYVLQKLGLQTLLVSRQLKTVGLTYDQLNQDILSKYTVIVNTTPVGTFPHTDECPAIPYEFLTSKHLLYDVVYNPSETLFLKKGKERGAQTLNGEGMLTGQAIAAWEIWNA